MIAITSMGGCGSTEFIHWFSRHIDCNCSMNSEGLPGPGPGANPKGLKHRIRPPSPTDPYLPPGKTIEKSLFLFDSPYSIIPSLFRRQIAVGHAIAITGSRPDHDNDLDRFLNEGIDSFAFGEQFAQWSDETHDTCPYPRMLARASNIWAHLPEVFAFFELASDLRTSFPRRKDRESSFERLSPAQQAGLREIYADLDSRIAVVEDVRLI
jgi:hypothetical protein